MEIDENFEDSLDPFAADCEDRILKRSRLPRQAVQSKKFCAKDERNASLKKVSVILQKAATDRSFEESQVLNDCSEAVEEVQTRWRKRDEAKRRLEEIEEPPEVLEKKCLILAQAIAQAQHLVVYTGAGISTAAKIPDYRGPNGIWTRLQQGKDIGAHDLSLAEPTFTHMALSELYKKKILKYVVSQNCDGLHLRSGLPRTALSELHGNMYIEVCKNCKPTREYWRLFDVTENTARYSHKTSRKCYICNAHLVDTIVHFGERGKIQWPLNWSGACKNAEKATTIICLGSSLKVLKKYPWLWRMDKPAKKRPNLYIVNLQWTPKDDVANVKINGKCDEIMGTVMRLLDIEVPSYEKINDPIFVHGSLLGESEDHTTSQPFLKPDCRDRTSIKSELCDNSNKASQEDCLPKEAAKKSFSIDSILNRVQKQAAPPNYPFLNYSSLFQCQFLNSFSELIYYPYQTSLLYSGLHSIINPVSEFAIAEETIKSPKREPSCEFCDTYYNSDCCLFYPKVEPVFRDPMFRFSKIEKKEKLNVCVCCDYTTEEEDVETNENKEMNGEKDKSKIQAGWFGKGYRKSRRWKKKSS